METRLESVCPLDCPDTCSLTATVAAGRLIAVDASARNPVTDGFICAKVRRYPERVYSPLRVLQPLRRVGPKGVGRFEPISWEDAIALLVAKFRAASDGFGSESILPYHYGGSSGLFSEGGADARFFHLLGASRLKKTLCAGPTGAARQAMYGSFCGVPTEDYDRARCIVLWGVNPSATSIHLEAQLRRARAAGAFVVAIDPRRTKSVRNADLHLAVRPGTDVVLALAVANRIIVDGGCDTDFLSRWVNGFDEFAAAAARYSVVDAARICGVPVAGIEEFIARYTAAHPAVVRCGWGVERNRNGGNAVRAILALPAIAAKFGVRGGGFTMSMGGAHPIDRDGLARPDLQPRPTRTLNMTRLGRLLTEPLDPPIKVLFVYNCNPVAVTPDQNRVIRGLLREDLFTVVHEQVLTDSCAYADLVLPATTVFEQAELHNSYGHLYLQYSDPVIAPVGEAVSNAELFRRLAAAMGLGSDELFSPDALLAAAVANARGRLGGKDAAALRRDGIARVHLDASAEVVQFGNAFPGTPSGKLELQPAGMGPIGYVPPVEEEFPLVLLSPASHRTINSIFAEFNLLDPRLELHPDDAAARAIRDGAMVRVFNQLGEVHVRAALSGDLRPGIVVLPKGLWRTATANGATATALAPDHLSDYGEGACYNDARVEVAPLLAA